MATLLQQGESLQFAGSLLRRAKGAEAFEIVEDLTPYGIVLTLLTSSGRSVVYDFAVTKYAGAFGSDILDTSRLPATTYTLTAALIIEGVTIIANNTLGVVLERSIVGASLTPTAVSGGSSETSGTIEAGEWEYRLDVAQTGSDADVNSESFNERVLSFSMGTVLKGDPFPYKVISEAEYSALEEFEDVLYIVTAD